MAKGVKKLLKEILKAENKMLKMLELGYMVSLMSMVAIMSNVK